MPKPVVNTAVERSRLLCVEHGRDAISARLARIDAPEVAPLNGWVRRVQGGGLLSPESAATIPWFDPDSGGVGARVLLLLQDPSRTASSTRFISPDNNDPTARCTTEACREAGLSRPLRLHWNVYPWWVNAPGASKTKGGAVPDTTRPAETWPAARRIAARLTGDVFALLPRLRVVVVLGVEAHRGFDAVVTAGLRLPGGVDVLRAPSLSPPGFHRHRAAVIAELRRAATLATQHDSPHG